MKEYLHAFTTISRYEYWPGLAPGLLVPILYGLSSLEQLLTPVIIEMIIICILLYFSGFVINSLADRELDKKYNTFKSQISEAVDLLGIKRVKGILAFQVITAILLSLHLSVVLGNPWLFILVCTGAFFGLGYSVEPFYFKVKGIWHAISLGLSAFFIPLMFIYLIVAETIDLYGILLIIGVSIAHYSLAMANQAADHLEDQKEGVLTPPVRLGLEKTLKWSLYVTTAGMIFIILVIGAIYFNSVAETASGSQGLPFYTFSLMFGMVALIIGIGYYVPLKGLRDLFIISGDSIPMEDRMERIGNRINYASWQASGIIGVAITLGILFVASLSAPLPRSSPDIAAEDISAELDIANLRIANVFVSTGAADQQATHSELTVRTSLSSVEEPEQITQVSAVVEAGTANEVFSTASDRLDTNGRAVISIDLKGINETEVWYVVRLVYNGMESSYTWTEPSVKELYIYDAGLKRTEVILSDKVTLHVKAYNSGHAKSEGTIKMKIEWSPLIVDWVSNNKTVNPGQVWELTSERDLLKDMFVESSSVKIYLYYDDTEFDQMELEF
jgi:4-hydroxybenzoate polyprenyltransferase